MAIVILKPTVGEAEGMEGVENGFVFLTGYGPKKGIAICDLRFAIRRIANCELRIEI